MCWILWEVKRSSNPRRLDRGQEKINNLWASLSLNKQYLWDCFFFKENTYSARERGANLGETDYWEPNLCKAPCWEEHMINKVGLTLFNYLFRLLREGKRKAQRALELEILMQMKPCSVNPLDPRPLYCPFCLKDSNHANIHWAHSPPACMSLLRCHLSKSHS